MLGTEVRCLGDSQMRMSSGQETKTYALLMDTQRTPWLYYHLHHVVDTQFILRRGGRSSYLSKLVANERNKVRCCVWQKVSFDEPRDALA
jgi:hypothetical protein